MNGTAIKSDFLVISNDPNKIPVESQAINTGECCFEINVLAEEVKTNQLFNDVFSYIRFFNKDTFISGAVFTLQKDKEDVAVLTDDTYGTNYALGFYETIYNENAKGYLLDFNKILNLLGEGEYRIKSTATNIFATIITEYSLELCLKKYTIDRADTTCRVEWYRSGNNGNPENVESRLDFGSLNWKNQLRIPAIFGADRTTGEREYVKYQTGKQVWTNDTLKTEYSLLIDPIPNYLHSILKFDMLQADEIRITDYNRINPTGHIELKVIPAGGYEPEYDFNVLLSPVELTFADGIEQFSHKRS